MTIVSQLKYDSTITTFRTTGVNFTLSPTCVILKVHLERIMVLRNDAVYSLKHGQYSYYECQLSLHSTGDVHFCKLSQRILCSSQLNAKDKYTFKHCPLKVRVSSLTFDQKLLSR